MSLVLVDGRADVDQKPDADQRDLARIAPNLLQ